MVVANGLAFTADGRTLYVGDTARGALWRVQLDQHGNLRGPVGCDTTFPADTLCLDDVFVAHPFLEGVDGIALEFPTSPFLTDRKLCITQSNGNRRDNFPNSGGQVGPGLPEVAKISCMDQRLAVSGLPLPMG